MIFKKFFKNPISKARAQRRAILTDITQGGQDLDGRDLVELLRGIVGGKDDVYIARADRDYRTVDESVLHAFLRGDGTDAYRWTPEGGDCDDFAAILLGRIREAQMLASSDRAMAVGEVWALSFWLEEPGKPPKQTDPHAMVFAVLNDRRVVLIEPQDDKIYPLTSKSSVYFISV